MSNISRIHISIAFGDAILPVIDCDDGHKRVPLKPIVDQIGAQWERQRKKIQPDTYLWRRLGAKITVLKYGELTPKPGNPTHLCIRYDRVTAFLNRLNPENIRAMGNDEAADWLEAKHEEWDDALHQYEENGFVSKVGRGGAVDAVAKIDRIKSPALKRIAAQKANEEHNLSIPIGNQGELEV